MRTRKGQTLLVVRTCKNFRQLGSPQIRRFTIIYIYSEIGHRHSQFWHNVFNFPVKYVCGPRCATIYDLFQVIKHENLTKCFQFILFQEEKTSLSELQEDTTTTNDNFTFGQHSNAFKKYLKRTYSVNYESTSVRTAFPRCGLVGACFAQQCNIFAPILLFCILDLFFFADLQRHWHILQRGPWPQNVENHDLLT